MLLLQAGLNFLDPLLRAGRFLGVEIVRSAACFELQVERARFLVTAVAIRSAVSSILTSKNARSSIFFEGAGAVCGGACATDCTSASSAGNRKKPVHYSSMVCGIVYPNAALPIYPLQLQSSIVS